MTNRRREITRAWWHAFAQLPGRTADGWRMASLPVEAPARRRLGEVLVARGLLTEDQLAWALDVQSRTGSRLGSILVASGIVRRLPLYTALADEWGLPFVDIGAHALDDELLARVEPSRLANEGWLPLEVDSDGTVLVATCEEPTGARQATIEATLGAPVRFAGTTDWDIQQGLRRGYRELVLDDAAYGLWRRNGDQSARHVVIARQKVALVAVLCALVIAFAWAPLGTLVVLTASGSLAFLASVTFKFVVCLVGARRERDEGVTAAEVAALRDDELPMYTVLVPVYREANVVADLLENLGSIDYPSEKLEILLLLEEDDVETIEAARAARPPENFTFVVVPDGLPKTKPKACNVGLFFARGDLLVIYDAEDRPDPDQLKKAVIAFRRGDERLVCVQAALNYWNDEENWLTRMFTLEYSFWFDYMLPGLDALRLPIPLGGTSNHFRTDALRRLGGWDPFNVTEDADLGIRASALGYTVGVVNSTTYEEANRNRHNWVRQRSRWIKGYMQTLLVHLRHPVQLARTAGVRQSLAFALLIGGTPFTFLMTPPLLALFAVSLLVSTDALAEVFPQWVLWVSLANLLLGNAAMVYVSMMGAFKRRRYRLVPWAIVNPAYWMLHAIASYKALWQLVTRPHYWEKTLHGLSTVRATASEAGHGVVGPPAASA
jgi:cellulose synthase/poly-beta-1,6-N-acetylglucosamine synthase-like glycosyltransferase